MTIGSIRDNVGQNPKGRPRLVLFKKESTPNRDLEELEGLLAAFYRKIRISLIIQDNQNLLSLFKIYRGKLEFHCGGGSLQSCDQGPVSGSIMRVGYDEWRPIFYTKENGEGFGGIMQDVLMLFAARLNTTPVYVKNDMPGIWGTLDANRTWNGMIGQLFRDEVDIVIAGHAPNAERHDVVDFTHDLMKTNVALFARRNMGIKLTIKNYLSEFDSSSWLCIVITSISSIGALHLILFNTNKKSTNLEMSATIVLRALIQKSTDTKSMSRISWKIATLSVFVFATLLFASYRACLNAFLAVVNKPIEIENLSYTRQRE
jgi:hypothetical protein